ncbi:MAG: DNA repair protein RecO [Limnochordia bacterium]|nr:DNA repair protein RecO [Limnochordia bacterium]
MYTTEGVILRTRNLGEADKIVTVYTNTRGKVAAVARGARRTRNRLLSVTQVFTCGRYLMFEGKSLDTLSQGEIIHSFQAIRDDLEKMASAMYVCELVDVFVEEEEANKETFDLLLNTLRLIEAGEGKFALRVFELKFMQQLGYQPQLDQCVNCGGPVEEQILFSRVGGMVCGACRHKVNPIHVISKGTSALINRILEWDLSRLTILHPSNQSLEELEACMRSYIDYRLDKPMRSLEFINTLNDFPDSEVTS